MGPVISTRSVFRRLIILAAVLMLAVGALGADKNDHVLYAFKGGSDGIWVRSGLLADKSGNLYGTTFTGGAPCETPVQTGCGIVFQLVPPAARNGQWTENVLYSFHGTDGAGPTDNLTFDAAGNLYGTTGEGGQCCGTVFQLTAPSTTDGSWTFSTLYNFQGSPDGAQPNGSLIFDSAGNLYGTTYSGGATDPSGTIFELSPPTSPGGVWTETVLYAFDFLNHPGIGYNPVSGLVIDRSGDLYGVTNAGGIPKQGGEGVVFKLARPAIADGAWNYRVLHGFQGYPTDGAFPAAGLVFDEAGNLYGTTSAGGSHKCTVPYTQPCGTVFQLAPPLWTETVLYNFAGGSDGWDPQGGLVFHNHGILYGTTTNGGGACTDGGCGTIFELAPPASGSGAWTESVLYAFRGGNDGEWPSENLLFGKAGAIYGTTNFGGDNGNCPNTGKPPDPGCGTVFEFIP